MSDALDKHDLAHVFTHDLLLDDLPLAEPLHCIHGFLGRTDRPHLADLPKLALLDGAQHGEVAGLQDVRDALDFGIEIDSDAGDVLFRIRSRVCVAGQGAEQRQRCGEPDSRGGVVCVLPSTLQLHLVKQIPSPRVRHDNHSLALPAFLRPSVMPDGVEEEPQLRRLRAQAQHLVHEGLESKLPLANDLPRHAPQEAPRREIQLQHLGVAPPELLPQRSKVSIASQHQPRVLLCIGLHDADVVDRESPSRIFRHVGVGDDDVVQRAAGWRPC
mmetsp:Transcript_17408/g.66311  ORF Transcript_17408/g.66311 Transcript_17408/m.66311 type:complete len:272 (+) Transcript_17408:1093-1908(+)